MKISLEELRVQVALGTIDEKIQWSEICNMCDKEALRILGDCTDVKIRKAVAINVHTPFSVWKKMYTSDSDQMVRELAWEQVARRFKRLYKTDPPEPPWKDPWNNRPSDLPPDTLIYRS